MYSPAPISADSLALASVLDNRMMKQGSDIRSIPQDPLLSPSSHLIRISEKAFIILHLTTLGNREGRMVVVCFPILSHKHELAAISLTFVLSLAGYQSVVCEGEGSEECNLGQFWFYYALHTRGLQIRIKDSFQNMKMYSQIGTFVTWSLYQLYSNGKLLTG